MAKAKIVEDTVKVLTEDVAIPDAAVIASEAIQNTDVALKEDAEHDPIVESRRSEARQQAEELLKQYISVAQSNAASLNNGKTIPTELLEGFAALQGAIVTLHSIKLL